MSKTIEEIFEEKPYLYSMGANTIAKRYNLDVEVVKTFKRKRVLSSTIPKKTKILILDIETAPLKAYVWKRWKENISLDQTISEWFMIAWSAKWLEEDATYSSVLTSKEILHEDDSRIVKNLWILLDEADIIIAHNGKNFDIPKINSRFILCGCVPPSPYKQIDTLEVVKKQFGFSSNKLDALAIYFGFSTKLETGFELWKKCMEGDKDSLLYMEKYNRYDVQLLEKVYLKLRPWIPSHPNINLYNDSTIACTSCGSHNIIKGKYYYTNRNKYQTYRCLDCGAISRVTVGAIKEKLLVPIPK